MFFKDRQNISKIIKNILNHKTNTHVNQYKHDSMMK